MVKAVVFDLYETLVTQTGTAVPRAGTLSESLGLDAIAYRREWKRLRPLVLRGELTFEEALLQVGTRLGVGIPADAVRRASDERARANAEVFQKIDHGIIQLTRDLQSRGLRLAAISNCMEEDVRPWSGSALAPQFSCAIFSFAASCVKPDARIYLMALDQLGVRPAEALYIGDGGDDELAGAGRAGLRAAQAVWFVSRPPTDGLPVLANQHDVMRLVEQE